MKDATTNKIKNKKKQNILFSLGVRTCYCFCHVINSKDITVKSPFKIELAKTACTFDDKSLSQQAQMVKGLLIPSELLNASSCTHALGISIVTLCIMHFGQ